MAVEIRATEGNVPGLPRIVNPGDAIVLPPGGVFQLIDTDTGQVISPADLNPQVQPDGTVLFTLPTGESFSVSGASPESIEPAAGPAAGDAAGGGSSLPASPFFDDGFGNLFGVNPRGDFVGLPGLPFTQPEFDDNLLFLTLVGPGEEEVGGFGEIPLLFTDAPELGIDTPTNDVANFKNDDEVPVFLPDGSLNPDFFGQTLGDGPGTTGIPFDGNITHARNGNDLVNLDMVGGPNNLHDIFGEPTAFYGGSGNDTINGHDDDDIIVGDGLYANKHEELEKKDMDGGGGSNSEVEGFGFGGKGWKDDDCVTGDRLRGGNDTLSGDEGRDTLIGDGLIGRPGIGTESDMGMIGFPNYVPRNPADPTKFLPANLGGQEVEPTEANLLDNFVIGMFGMNMLPAFGDPGLGTKIKLRIKGGEDTLFGGEDEDLMIGDGIITFCCGADLEWAAKGMLPESHIRIAGGNDEMFGGEGGDWMVGDGLATVPLNFAQTVNSLKHHDSLGSEPLGFGAGKLRMIGGDDFMVGGRGGDVMIGDGIIGLCCVTGFDYGDIRRVNESGPAGKQPPGDGGENPFRGVPNVLKGGDDIMIGGAPFGKHSPGQSEPDSLFRLDDIMVGDGIIGLNVNLAFDSIICDARSVGAGIGDDDDDDFLGDVVDAFQPNKVIAGGHDVMFGGVGKDVMVGDGLLGIDLTLDVENELPCVISKDSYSGMLMVGGDDFMFGGFGHDFMVGDGIIALSFSKNLVGQDTFGDEGLLMAANPDLWTGGLDGLPSAGPSFKGDIQDYDVLVLGGHDRMRGGAGDDWMLGDGLLSLYGGDDDDDDVFLAGGNDRMFGGRGDDTMLGEGGDDLMVGDGLRLGKTVGKALFETDTDSDSGSRLQGGDDWMFGGSLPNQAKLLDHVLDKDAVGAEPSGLSRSEINDRMIGDGLVANTEVLVNGKVSPGPDTADGFPGGGIQLYGGNDKMQGGLGDDWMLGDGLKWTRTFVEDGDGGEAPSPKASVKPGFPGGNILQGGDDIMFGDLGLLNFLSPGKGGVAVAGPGDDDDDELYKEYGAQDFMSGDGILAQTNLFDNGIFSANESGRGKGRGKGRVELLGGNDIMSGGFAGDYMFGDDIVLDARLGEPSDGPPILGDINFYEIYQNYVAGPMVLDLSHGGGGRPRGNVIQGGNDLMYGDFPPLNLGDIDVGDTDGPILLGDDDDDDDWGDVMFGDGLAALGGDGMSQLPFQADDDDDDGANTLTGGNDTMYGGRGGDQMWGDGIITDSESDSVQGGNDTMYGGFGDDDMWGDGLWLISGAGATSKANGGDDFDTGGDDSMFGGRGNDRMHGNGGNDTVMGDEGSDTVWGDSGDDTVQGGSGNDDVFGGTGSDLGIWDGGLDHGAGDFYDGNRGDTDPNGDGDNNDPADPDMGTIFDTLRLGLTEEQLMNGDLVNELLAYQAQLSQIGGDTIQFDFNEIPLSVIEWEDVEFFLHDCPDLVLERIVSLDNPPPFDPDNPSDPITEFAGNVDENELIIGGDGKDTIAGDNDLPLPGVTKFSDDLILGGDGKDTIYGDLEQKLDAREGGDDKLIGGDGKDLLIGDTGDAGENGNMVNGAIGGDDKIYGDNFDESLDGAFGGEGASRDELYGDAYNDMIDSTGGNDMLFGGDGKVIDETVPEDGLVSLTSSGKLSDNTVVFGDAIYGDAGNNMANSTGGDDYIEGGDGKTVIRFDETSLDGVGEVNTLGGEGSNENTVVFGKGLYGDAGNDMIASTGGNDTIIGGDGKNIEEVSDPGVALGAAAETLGGEFEAVENVVVFGTAIYGDAGRHLLEGSQGGNDTIYGGDGKTVEEVTSTRGTIDAGAVAATLSVVLADNVAVLGDAIYGDAGRDLQASTGGHDYIEGGDGKDIGPIVAEGGRVELSGVETLGDIDTFNNTAIFGNAIYGDAGRDMLDGSQGGNDEIVGGDGKRVDTSTLELIEAEFGGEPGVGTLDDLPNFITDDDGNLIFAGTAIYGDAGRDIVESFGGDDEITGGDGKDFITGDAGQDILADGEFGAAPANANGDSASGGHDTIFGGDGKDSIAGDAGRDILAESIFVDTDADSDGPTARGGNDTIFGGDGKDVVDGDIISGDAGRDIRVNVEELLLVNGDAAMAIGGSDTVYGGAGEDVIYGDAGRNIEVDEGAPDGSMAVGGNDTLDGGVPGDDPSFGDGSGDSIFGDAGNDIIGMGAKGGDDTIFGGDGKGSDNDLLAGDAGNDLLDGAVGGNDEIDGGVGNDIIVGDAANNEGEVPPEDIPNGDENAMVNATGGDDTGFGGAGNDILIGDGRGDASRSVMGNDWLEGGTGDDQIFGDMGAGSTLPAGFGDDNLGTTDFGSPDLDDSSQGGDDTLFGNEGNDFIVGDAEDDIQGDSSGGNDTLFGGADNDILYGDAADVTNGAKGVTNTVRPDNRGQPGDSGGPVGGNDTLDGGDPLESPESDAGMSGNGSDTAYGGFGSDLGIWHGDGSDVDLYDGGGGDGGLTPLVGGDPTMPDTSDSTPYTEGMDEDGSMDTLRLALNTDQLNDDSAWLEILAFRTHIQTPGATTGDDVIFPFVNLDDDADVDLYAVEWEKLEITLADCPDHVIDLNGDISGFFDTLGNNATFVGSGNLFLAPQSGFGPDDDFFHGVDGDDTLIGDGDEQVRDLADILAADPSTPIGIPFSGDGFNLTSMGQLAADDTEDYTVWRLRNGSDSDEFATLVHTADGTVVFEGIVPANTDLFVTSPFDGTPATHKLFIAGEEKTKAAGPQIFSFEVGGGLGDDFLLGGEGNDTVLGDRDADLVGETGGDDKLYGGDNNDIIVGDTGLEAGKGNLTSGKLPVGLLEDETVGATGGDDRIFGGDGFDTAYGDAANDIIESTGGNDLIDGGMNNDLLSGDAGNDLLSSEGGDDEIYGGTGLDTIYGDAKRNLAASEAAAAAATIGVALAIAPGEGSTGGHDTIEGGDSRDTISGDAGNDLLDGSTGGNDEIDGGEGNDLIFGDAGNNLEDASTGGDDTIEGGSGDDSIVGDAGNDLIEGSLGGNDTIYGGEGNDEISGDAGENLERSEGGDDHIEADNSAGNDTVYGDAVNDLIFSFGGDDVIDGGEGNDYLFGDAGGDLIGSTGGNDEIDGGEGNDRISGDAGDDLRADEFAPDVTRASAGGNDTVYGGDGNDTISGDAGFGDDDDILEQSRGGNDTLEGGDGRDTVFGDAGGDIGSEGVVNGVAIAKDNGDPSIGFGGDDWIYGDAGNDRLFGDAGENIIGAAVLDDELVRSSGGDDVMFGGSGNDTMIGDAGNDVRAGAEGGDDTLKGGSGNDLLSGDAGDEVDSGDVEDDETIRASFGGDDKLVGGDGNDVISGDALRQVDGVSIEVDNAWFDGDNARIPVAGKGSFGGDDKIFGGEGADLLFGDAGEGIVKGGGSFQIFAGNLDDFSFGGDDYIEAGTGNDYLSGDAGEEVRDGSRGGNDTLLGEDGNDTLTGDAGNDIVGQRVTIEPAVGDDLEALFETGTDEEILDVLRAAGTLDFDGDTLTLRLDGGSDINVNDEEVEVSYYIEGTGGHGGNDTLIGGKGNDKLFGDSENQITGDSSGGDDTLFGEDGNDTLAGDDDNDLDSNSVGGDDTLFGGTGNDRISGDSDDDIDGELITLTNDDGDDRVILIPEARSVGGNDELFGGAGNDTLFGDARNEIEKLSLGGDDTLKGGKGDDKIYGDAGGDIEDLAVGGNDTLYGEEGEDFLVGDADDEIRRGGVGGDDTLFGGDDRDLLIGDAREIIDAQKSGNDEFQVSADGSGGNDTLFGGDDDDLLFGDINANPTVFGEGGPKDFLVGDFMGKLQTAEDLGLGGDDTLFGGDGDDILDGQSGSDTVFGGEGSDWGIWDGMVADTGTDYYHGNGNDDGEDTRDPGLDGDDNDPGTPDEGFEEDVLYLVLTGDQIGDSTTYQELVAYFDLLDQDEGDTVEFTFTSLGLTVVEWEDVVVFLKGCSGLELGDPRDWMVGDGSSETLTGTENDDIILGLGGDDDVIGDPGNAVSGLDIGDDVLFGGDGNDRLFGDRIFRLIDRTGGDDKLFGGDGTDILVGDTGIAGGRDDEQSNAQGGNDLLSGGTGADMLFGDAEGDVQSGSRGGNDEMFGDAGDDEMFGDAGQDVINDSTGGNDEMFGGDGNDVMSGDAGRDIAGGDSGDSDGGNDKMYGDAGDDIMDGDAGRDIRDSSDAGNDTMYGGDDDDDMSGDAGRDIVDGSTGGNDTMYGDDGDDEMFGDARRNMVDSGGGDDYMHGDCGNDTLIGDAGNDLTSSSGGNDDLFGDDGDDLLIGDAGNEVNDSAGGNDELQGGEGDDTLVGDAGNDMNDSDGGDDTLEGQDGDDVIIGDAGGEVDNGSDGGADELYGGRGDDELVGDGNDLQDDSQGGNDYLDGGEGDDTLFGDAREDIDDTNDTGSDGGNDTLEGGDGDDELFGDAGGDITGESSGGNDDLYGGDGNDLLVGDAGGEIDSGSSGGNDTLEGGRGDDELWGDAMSGIIGGGISGEDTFVYSLSEDSGSDTIFDTETQDTLELNQVLDYNGGGVDLSDLDSGAAAADGWSVTDDVAGGDIVITFGTGSGGSGTVTLAGAGTGTGINTFSDLDMFVVNVDVNA